MSGRTQSHKTRKILGSVVVIGVLGGLVGLGAFSAFTATTANTGNSIASGSVAISQHSGATTLFSLTNQKGGDSSAKCVRISYTGSLAASVKAYASAGITNGSNYTVQVERGSGITAPAADMNCTGFTAGSTAFATAGMDTLPTSYAAGIDGKASGAAWAQNDTVDYRITATTVDDATANAHTSTNSTGTFSVTWEARNN